MINFLYKAILQYLLASNYKTTVSSFSQGCDHNLFICSKTWQSQFILISNVLFRSWNYIIKKKNHINFPKKFFADVIIQELSNIRQLILKNQCFGFQIERWIGAARESNSLYTMLQSYLVRYIFHSESTTTTIIRNWYFINFSCGKGYLPNLKQQTIGK